MARAGRFHPGLVLDDSQRRRARAWATALAACVLSLTPRVTWADDTKTHVAPTTGLRYGADVSVAAIADRDHTGWAGGASGRLGYAFDDTYALYASAVALVGPYFRVGALASFEVTSPGNVRVAAGAGVTDTPRFQVLCADEPCGPDGFYCFPVCEHNAASFTATLRVAPLLPIPTDPHHKLFSLAFQIELDVQPSDGEIRGVSVMSFAFDEVAR
jgi:hypothetical protein